MLVCVVFERPDIQRPLALFRPILYYVCQISLSSMIDADWTIGRERADIAGKILADALLNREQVRLRTTDLNNHAWTYDQGVHTTHTLPMRCWICCSLGR